jgi:hypothetical protein
LRERYFQVKIEDELPDYHLIRAGVPKDSVLGALLYLIFTADVSLTDNTLMATFTDTAIMSSDQDLTNSSQKLQEHLNLLQTWMEQWKFTVNPAKSTQHLQEELTVHKLASITSPYLSNRKLNTYDCILT